MRQEITTIKITCDLCKADIEDVARSVSLYGVGSKRVLSSFVITSLTSITCEYNDICEKCSSAILDAIEERENIELDKTP